MKVIDNGALDKRLFVLDEELAGALTVTKKEETPFRLSCVDFGIMVQPVP